MKKPKTTEKEEKNLKWKNIFLIEVHFLIAGPFRVATKSPLKKFGFLLIAFDTLMVEQQ